MNVTFFQCKDALGRNSLVKADSYASGTIFTHDPEWAVSYDNGSTFQSGIEWMSLIADDGSVWSTKMHASAEGDDTYVHLWLENKRQGEGNGKEGTIDVLDWANNKWKLSFDRAQKKSDPVTFVITKY